MPTQHKLLQISHKNVGQLKTTQQQFCFEIIFIIYAYLIFDSSFTTYSGPSNWVKSNHLLVFVEAWFSNWIVGNALQLMQDKTKHTNTLRTEFISLIDTRGMGLNIDKKT